jgi:nitronate monooxygenase
VLSVGFATSARPPLVAAVSNAGGMGVLGASGMSPRALGADARTAELTDRPFGINLIIAAEPNEQTVALVRAQIESAGRAGAAAAVLFWGDPKPYVQAAHDAGLHLLVQVGSVGEAEEAAASGVDAVIAQGVEAGGHVRGTTSIWELLPAVGAAIAPTPVLASGGIGDGRGLARALRFGAQAVSFGTRFVASEEADVHRDYQRRIVAACAADTVLTPDLYDVGWPGAPHRTLRNRTYDRWVEAGRPPPGGRPGEGAPIGRQRLASGRAADWPRYAVGMATADFDGDVEDAPLWAGESCSVVDDVKPAGEIVRELVATAAAALDEP